jgi:hypothetical protein
LHQLTSEKKECIGSGVVAEGGVFLVTGTGFGVCLDKADKQMWEQRLPSGEGSWSLLVLTNQSGRVSVLAASPKFELLGTNAIPLETTCSSLASANGHVFLPRSWSDVVKGFQTGSTGGGGLATRLLEASEEERLSGTRSM